MPYNNASSSFQAILMPFFENSAEVVRKVSNSNGHEIVSHFHHRWRCRLELMHQLSSEKMVQELLGMNWNHYCTAYFFFYQPSSVHGWTSAFLLAVHRLCGVIEGRLSHFLPPWLRTGWQSAISQGKIP